MFKPLQLLFLWIKPHNPPSCAYSTWLLSLFDVTLVVMDNSFDAWYDKILGSFYAFLVSKLKSAFLKNPWSL